MEKPSRLFVPLAVAASLISADNATANGGSISASEVQSPLSLTEQFCEELRDAMRNAKGPNINDYVVGFIPNRHGTMVTIVETIINREIKTVMENGQEVRLSCFYGTTRGVRRPGEKSAKKSVESFSEDLFSLDDGSEASGFTATTLNAEYADNNMDGFPDRVTPINSTGESDYSNYMSAMRAKNSGEPPTILILNAPCVEGEAPDVCEDLGVGLDDFDAAVTAGRRALAVVDDE